VRTAELQKAVLFVQMKRPKSLIKTKVEYIREPSFPHVYRTISVLNIEPDNHQVVQTYKKQFAECLVKEIKDKLNYKVRKAIILDFFPGPEGPSYQDLR
jgi:hypothetical protein